GPTARCAARVCRLPHGLASEGKRHLRRDAARWRKIELRVADLALRHVVTIVAEIAASHVHTHTRHRERESRVHLVEWLVEEPIAAIERTGRLVSRRDPAADPL